MQLSGGNRNLFAGGGRNWLTLVVSLLLAFFMWATMKLSEDYSSYVRYKVDVSTNITGRKNIASSSDALILSVKSSGFYIVKNKTGKRESVISLENLDSRLFRKYGQEGDLFYLLTQDVKQKIQEALGTEAVAEYYATDTLFFNFPLQAHKRVPVKPRKVVTCSGQFMTISEMSIKPDSIYVYGDREVIAGIGNVSTGLIKENNVMESISGVVKILPIEDVRFSAEEVLYSQEVSRYVESSLNIPIVIENVPTGVEVVAVPYQVTVKYRLPFNGARQLRSSDFAVTVDYLDILNNEVVQPVISKQPENLLGVDIEPKFVECIL